MSKRKNKKIKKKDIIIKSKKIREKKKNLVMQRHNSDNDQGMLIIHGVGNQEEGNTLQKYGGSLRDRALLYRGSSLVYGTDEEIISGEKKDIKVSLGDESEYDNLYIREVHWAKDYRRELKNKTLWVLTRIHLIALLLFFDIRDEKFIKNPYSNIATVGMAYRFYARLLTLLAICMLIINFFVCIFLKSMFIGLIVIIAVLVSLILFIEKCKWNLSNDVRIAVSLEHIERKEIFRKIDNEIKEFPSSVKGITLVAHSQGGYLIHQYLTSKNYRPSKRIKAFAGIGSGLGAIHIISLTQGLKNLLLSWFIFIITLFSFLVFFMDMWDSLELVITSIYAFIYAVGGFIITFDGEFFVDIVSFISGGISSIFSWDLYKNFIYIMLLMVPVAMIKHYWYKNIRNIPQNIIWEEYSSVRDIVGRMTPIIARGSSSLIPREVGLLGSPWSVHTKYFHDSSSLPSVLVSRLYSEKYINKYENMQKNLYMLTIRQRYISSVSAILFSVLIMHIVIRELELYGKSYVAFFICVSFILTIKILILLLRFILLYTGKLLGNLMSWKNLSIIIGEYRITDSIFISFISGVRDYRDLFSPISKRIQYFIGGIIAAESVVLAIFSFTYSGNHGNLPGLATIFFLSVFYFFTGLCIILGYSFKTLKGAFGGVVGIIVLIVTNSLCMYFPHIAILYLIILFVVILYAWISWFKIENMKGTNADLDVPRNSLDVSV